MPWLNYSDDELARFHPEFESATNEALRRLRLQAELEWVHHIRSPGNTLTPDFVLRRRTSLQWLLSFEIKRRKESVFSTRNQIQAKGYAETNQHLYGPSANRYFAISNLEITILCALNGDRPPRECHLLGGTTESGNFSSTPQEEHRERFITDLMGIIRVVSTGHAPRFDAVWPSVLATLVAHSSALPASDYILLPEPDTPYWSAVRDFFSAPRPVDSARVFFLRCLMSEYLRGILIKFGHKRGNGVPALQPDPAAVANTIAALRQIDFSLLFETFAPQLYRAISDITLRNQLIEYSTSLVAPGRRVVEFARDRVDAPDLIDSIIPAFYPVEVQDRSGKVQTDPELAALLARLTIVQPVQQFLDPCCGDGVLLAAGYDRLFELSGSDQAVLAAVRGIEADAVAARLAEIRLALRQPSTLEPAPPINIIRGDLFANSGTIGQAQVVLMNPPFMRYEEQQGHRLPQPIRDHYDQAIRGVDEEEASTTSGQANLYNYYVEFVVRSAGVGTRLGIILDNRWYHSRYGKALREFLLSHCEIDGIIEYPHWAFFAEWTIATSLLVIRKVQRADREHIVQFIRSKVDPRAADLDAVAAAFHEGEVWPTDWICRTKLQSELQAAASWKQYFSSDLKSDFRLDSWPTLPDLFEAGHRGSLDKEGGGISVYEFPFNRTNYGPRRSRHPRRVGWQTMKDRALTREENERLRTLASAIPEEFRGWALHNSDDLDSFIVSVETVSREQTIEPPNLRHRHQEFLDGRSEWTETQEVALQSMRSNPDVAAYISEVENLVNMTETVLPKEKLWVCLREPIAGELIIPRKARSGHRVHINPFAFDLNSRQVRTSSNFITYRNCIATDEESGLSRDIATRLIAAFLVSSFGQLQFELEGYNREGLLAVEMHHLEKVRVFDPRWIRTANIPRILDAFAQLAYPISTNMLSGEQTERNSLDRLFASEIESAFPEFDAEMLLAEIHSALDEWLIARQP